MKLLWAVEVNAKIQVITFFTTQRLRAMGGSQIAMGFQDIRICGLLRSLCVCQGNCQSGRWRGSSALRLGGSYLVANKLATGISTCAYGNFSTGGCICTSGYDASFSSRAEERRVGKEGVGTCRYR